MRFKALTLALALGLVMLPTAFADSVDFHGLANGGTWSFSGVVGSTLTATYNSVTVNKGGPSTNLPGAVYTFTTGANTGSTTVAGVTTYTFAGGGSVTVSNNSDANPNNCAFTAGGPSGGNCFLGTFTNSQFVTNGSPNSAFAGAFVTGTVDPYILSLLGIANPSTAVQGAISATFFGNTPSNGQNAGSSDLIVTQVPEPGSLMLFGSGLVGLAGIVRRKLRG